MDRAVEGFGTVVALCCFVYHESIERIVAMKPTKAARKCGFLVPCVVLYLLAIAYTVLVCG